MKRLILFVMAFAIFAAVGCSKNLEDKYGEGREQQKAKADKMINDTEE